MTNRKKYIILLAGIIAIFGSIHSSYSQHYVGARVGYGSGSARFYPKREMGSVWGLYSGGVSWKYYTREKFVGGVEADLQFLQQGFKAYQPFPEGNVLYGDTTSYHARKVNTLMVPIFWQPHAYLFRQKVRVFINLGVTFSVNFSSTYENGSTIQGVTESGKYNMSLVRDNPFSYGLVGGGGIGYTAGRIESFVEARYYIGYGDILRNANKYPPNQYQRSPLDGLQISVGVYVRLGKGGILAEPSEKVKQRMLSREMRNGYDNPERDGTGQAVTSDNGIVGEVESELTIITEPEEQPGEAVVPDETEEAGPETEGIPEAERESAREPEEV